MSFQNPIYNPQKLEKMNPDVKQKDESVQVSRCAPICYSYKIPFFQLATDFRDGFRDKALTVAHFWVQLYGKTGPNIL
jgi:hypothetical protein